MSGPALTATTFAAPLDSQLSTGPGRDLAIYWLGQAGFVIDGGGKRIVIDPYLSDSLAQKYRGKPYPHERMAPPPLDAAGLGAVDLVLCTHHHTDHMDGETLRTIALLHPNLRFVVPAASIDLARERIGVADSRLVGVDAGQHLDIDGIGIDVFRAAHETLERDELGHHKFLGYGLTLAGRRIFHSGDTIRFDGQVEEVANFRADLALLPVNGRRSELSDAGFAGNLSLAEAIGLCEAAAMPAMIAHHYGLFAFNTADPAEIDAAATTAPLRVERAKYQVSYRLDDL